MIPRTLSYTFVGGPKHGHTEQAPIPEIGLPLAIIHEPDPDRAGFIRYGRYCADSDTDAATGVLRWQGWGASERPLP